MKRCISPTTLCLLLSSLVGCGSDNANVVVETEISDKDQRAADQSVSQYDTPDYAESMSSQNE
ncbi:MAG: hypothetical protein VYA84_16990 [Planctomycetota bacterium]|nr:hypothetical protein [Planctomycetota bacterium]